MIHGQPHIVKQSIQVQFPPPPKSNAPTSQRKMGRRVPVAHVWRRPSRRRDLGRWVQGPFRINEQGSDILCLIPVHSCGRWDLNPHERIAHKILSLARLPVPTLPPVTFRDANDILTPQLYGVNYKNKTICPAVYSPYFTAKNLSNTPRSFSLSMGFTI